MYIHKCMIECYIKKIIISDIKGSVYSICIMQDIYSIAEIRLSALTKSIDLKS